VRQGASQPRKLPLQPEDILDIMNAAAERISAGCELATEVARGVGEVQLKLTGTSMVPAVWPGDVVTVRRLNPSEFRTGQIVLYRRENSLTAHRIVGAARGALILQGDSLPGVDPPVGDSQVVGEVVAIDREGRPVSLKQTWRHRAVSSIMRRSELCRHLTLRLGSSLWCY
jgi:signal peptidase I